MNTQEIRIPIVIDLTLNVVAAQQQAFSIHEQLVPSAGPVASKSVDSTSEKPEEQSTISKAEKKKAYNREYMRKYYQKKRQEQSAAYAYPNRKPDTGKTKSQVVDCPNPNCMMKRRFIKGLGCLDEHGTEFCTYRCREYFWQAKKPKNGEVK